MKSNCSKKVICFRKCKKVAEEVGFPLEAERFVSIINFLSFPINDSLFCIEKTGILCKKSKQARPVKSVYTTHSLFGVLTVTKLNLRFYIYLHSVPKIWFLHSSTCYDTTTPANINTDRDS